MHHVQSETLTVSAVYPCFTYNLTHQCECHCETVTFSTSSIAVNWSRHWLAQHPTELGENIIIVGQTDQLCSQVRARASAKPCWRAWSQSVLPLSPLASTSACSLCNRGIDQTGSRLSVLVWPGSGNGLHGQCTCWEVGHPHGLPCQFHCSKSMT